ncbi:MAG: hypothetical protein EZS28_050656 [Streblomastix strix]|uniref:Uncharacterized protein n=1 Tax=Streblomastix strix TaxID=222440 RepID=A0A5J4T5W3_9EUKA|nr:MAG: hypothetical protein EZS28_050656 [Streblomastix strix]
MESQKRTILVTIQIWLQKKRSDPTQPDPTRPDPTQSGSGFFLRVRYDVGLRRSFGLTYAAQTLLLRHSF